MSLLEDFSRSLNIAEDLEKEELDEIGRDALEEYQEDLSSRWEWEERNERWMKLATQVVEEKSWPWENASNVKYPLLTTAAVQFHARAYPALVPSGDLVRARVIGFDDTGMKAKKAIRISKHMTYQLMEEMSDWEDDMDKLCIYLPIVGCAFKKTYYSPILGRNVSEFVSAMDLVVNYWAKTLEDCSRKTHILSLSQNDVLERQRAGLYRNVSLQKNTGNSKGIDDEISGLTAPDMDDAPYKVLEQHTWLDLDDDGYKEPYIVTIDEAGTVLRIVARYTPADISYNAQNEVIKINAEEYFTKFDFIPNPDGGFYGIGFGVLLGPTNDAVNTILNQLIDQGTLATTAGGFIGRGARLKKGDTSFQPNEWKQVTVTGDDLRKNIFPLPIREPSSTLFNLLGMLLDSGNRLASTTDMMVGENPGQNQPATTTMAVIEQGMKVFTAIYKRIYRSLKKEYQKLYELNARYLSPEEYFVVLDPGKEQIAMIGQGDYDLKSMDVVPAADPNVITQAQRLAKAQALFDLVQLGTVNPQVATMRMLEAQEQPGIAQLVQMPPQQPNPADVREDRKLQMDYELRMKELYLEEVKLVSELKDKEWQKNLDALESILKEKASLREDFKAAAETQEKGNQYDESGTESIS